MLKLQNAFPFHFSLLRIDAFAPIWALGGGSRLAIRLLSATEMDDDSRYERQQTSGLWSIQQEVNVQ